MCHMVTAPSDNSGRTDDFESGWIAGVTAVARALQALIPAESRTLAEARVQAAWAGAAAAAIDLIDPARL